MTRECIFLAQGWRFQLDPDNAGERLGYGRADYDASTWLPLCVPCTLERAHPDLEWYVGTGWYRCDFTAPAHERAVLRFEGVNYHADVWLNGELLGRNTDGFLPFAFALGGRLRAGENVLVVRVDNAPVPGEVPGANVGWRPSGGILREVTLELTERCYLDDVQLLAEPQGADGGHFHYQAEVHNEGLAVDLTLGLQIADSTGQIVAHTETTLALATGEQRTVSLKGDVAAIIPWSPEHPALYTACATLRQGTEMLDTLATRFGFRRIEARGSQLLLNGAPIYLIGFNRHEDSPEVGLCTDLDTVRRDLLDMKALGCNFVRLCHYPHHPGELDLCDELGLLAMDEIPLYGSTGMAEDEAQYRAKLEQAQRQLTTLVRRDRNHPAVIFWSVSNETHEQYPHVAAGNAALIRHVRALDPTRLVVHVTDRWQTRWNVSQQFDADDVLCINGYPWMSRSALLEPGQEGGAAQAWAEGLAQLHARYPDKPILVSEFGARSYAGVRGNPAGEDAHARQLEAQFGAMGAPYVCGATIWCYADHAWPVGLREGYSASATSTSPFGVLTRARRPKAAVYEAVQRMFAARQRALRTGG